MKRQIRYLLVIGVLSGILAGAWLILSSSSPPKQASLSGKEKISGSGILDGMSFTGKVGPLGKPGDLKDTLVFKDGMFFSTECARRCGYPASPYFVRKVGDKIEFVSESRCTYKDANIAWRGMIDKDQLKGGFTWTLNRWYWNVEKEFGFVGVRTSDVKPFVGSQ